MVNKGRCLHRCRPYFFVYNEVEEKYKLNQGYFSPVMSSSTIRT
nr:MAG TPA: hypothetical protein [Caudoviricetes sp.]